MVSVVLHTTARTIAILGFARFGAGPIRPGTGGVNPVPLSWHQTLPLGEHTTDLKV